MHILYLEYFITYFFLIHQQRFLSGNFIAGSEDKIIRFMISIGCDSVINKIHL